MHYLQNLKRSAYITGPFPSRENKDLEKWILSCFSFDCSLGLKIFEVIGSLWPVTTWNHFFQAMSLSDHFQYRITPVIIRKTPEYWKIIDQSKCLSVDATSVNIWLQHGFLIEQNITCRNYLNGAVVKSIGASTKPHIMISKGFTNL